MIIPKDFINALVLELAKSDFTDLVKFYEAIGDKESAKHFDSLGQLTGDKG